MDLPEGFFLLLTVFLGLVLGSFATALSYRIPRGISMLAKGRSSCPSCGHDLGIPDLVPLFSWIFLRGKCRHCGAKIGLRYPLIELATLALCLAFYFRYGFSVPVLAFFALAPVVVSIIDIDFRHKIIPDGLNLSVALLALAGLLAQASEQASPLRFLTESGADMAGGGLLYGLVFVALRLAAMRALGKDPLGWGDIKFFAAAGLWLGPDPLQLAYFFMIAGVGGALLALFWKKIRGEAEFPFGPALVAAFTGLLLFYPSGFLWEWAGI